MTERLYYTDAFLREFSSPVATVNASGTRVTLCRTAFYPTSGGQPHDTGTLAGVPVAGVEEEGEEIVHVLGSPLAAEPGDMVEGRIDADRRFDHMQQHTGQHLLSAVLAREFGAETISFHMGADYATIDLAVPSLEESTIEAAELRSNRLIAQNARVKVTFEEAADVSGLRKSSQRTGTLRIIEIEGLDKSACGGTHVRSTGEIGFVLLRGLERVRGNVRLEFACGLRAVTRSRSEYRALSAIAQTFSSAVSDAPRLAAAQNEKLVSLTKAMRQQSMELAGYRGRSLFQATMPGPGGVRLLERKNPELDETARAEAQAFASGGKAIAILWSESPPALMVAASPDSGVHAGNILREVIATRGGRGGGSAQLAQGSVSEGSIQEVVEALHSAISRIGEQR